MDVGRTQGLGGPEGIQGPHPVSRVNPSHESHPATGPADKVDLTEHARFVSEALSLPPVRLDRVEEIRQLIESGRFETDARLGGALERFLDENRDLLA
jgi:hypothetical protein